MEITATKRGSQTKGERKTRLKQGYVPAAIYGKGLDPVSIEVSAKSVADVLLAESGMNTIIDLSVTGDKHKHTVMIDNLERDPITRGFRNVGFHQVKKGDKVTAQVRIHLIGTPRDVAVNGALLEQVVETITVHAKPTDLPPHIDVDVSNMKIGDVVRTGDLPRSAGVEFAQGDDVVIASVHVSTVAKSVEESSEAAGEPSAAAVPAATTE